MVGAASAARSALRRARRRLTRLAALVRRGFRRLRSRLSLELRSGPPCGIHLSWSEDPSRSLTVTWQTPGRRSVAEVCWRPARGGATSTTRGQTRSLPGTSRVQHRVVLRGLEPATEYLYQVSSDPGTAMGQGAWWRARTASASPADAFRVVFLCDVGIEGRTDGTTAAVSQVLQEIARDPPLFYLGGGDYASVRRDGRFRDPAEAMDRWFEQMQPLFACAPFMAEYGNHEVGLGESVAEWSARLAHPRGTADGLSYSFDVGPAHFVGLFAPGRPPPEAHLRWLEEDLTSEAARRAAWRIVFQHAPPVAHGAAHPARPDVAALRHWFERLAVDLHLSGHDQSYERTHPVSSAGVALPSHPAAGRTRYPARRGVVYAKVSPAGKLSERRRGFSRLAGPEGPEIAARSDRFHHLARIRVSEEALEVEVAGLSGEGAPVRSVDAFALERSD